VEHRFTLPGTTGPEVLVDQRFMRIPEVFVDGREIERMVERGRPCWLIPLADGTEKTLFLRGSITGLQGAVDGRLIRIEHKLALWELLLALLPFALVGLGFAGGLAGIVAAATNLRLVRRAWSTPRRLGALIGSFVVALAVTLVLLELMAQATR
jgi:hypothetical protein